MWRTTRQVVGDEQVAHAALRLEVREQVDDLALDGHVERGHRLVADDQVRLQGQRARDADALQLATRERRRPSIALRRVEAHSLQQRVGAATALGRGRTSVR